MNQAKEQLEKYGAIYIKNLVSVELSQFLTHILLRNAVEKQKEDQQVLTCISIMDHEIVFETLLERVWPEIEMILEEELLPTYAYTRLYTNGDFLSRHSDRSACEMSLTVQLGRSHHYSWPIYMGNKRYDMAEGDAILYRGCDIEHWRNVCDGPEKYYSGQSFLHFVRKNGPYSDQYGDSQNRDISPFHFIKNRSQAMNKK